MSPRPRSSSLDDIHSEEAPASSSRSSSNEEQYQPALSSFDDYDDYDDNSNYYYNNNNNKTIMSDALREPKIDTDGTFVVDESKLEVIPKLLAGELWSHDQEVVVSCLEKLADLCFHSDLEKTQEEQNRTALREFGGHLAIVVAMKKWMKYSDVQAAGCRALQNAGIVEDADSEAFHDLAVQVGALDTVLAAMKNFPTDEKVQKYGCGALLNLGWYLHNAEQLVFEANGVKAFLDAMKNFQDDISIQRRGCAFMKNLTTLDEKFNEPIIKAGGRPVLLVAIECHPEDDKEENSVQGNARVTLKRLL